MIFDEGIQVGAHCPNCSSTATEFEPYYKYWKCEDCSFTWHPEDENSFYSPDDDTISPPELNVGYGFYDPDLI